MNKVLVANRGEIALRIMRTLSKMGITTVAVYSDDDKNAPFVEFADESYHIGGSAPSESYLNQDKIMEVATSAHVDGIHPGYGFLSENAIFAKRVDDAGIKFIGPSIEAITIMGDKLSSKQAVKNYDVPMVPGTDEAIVSIEEGKKIAEGIGYPVMVKASAGGGGKGMRVVESSDEFEEQFTRAVSEAESAFGNGAVFIEKFVVNPKHVEIQVMADSHGNVIHLNERECSVQRRHQKVVEEAPSPIMTPDLRQRMGEAAINVAKSCNYEGAGTVEFLVDVDLNFYFLEMNTRLQVEHPVTEMTTGYDLVEQQIKIARGEELSIKQEDVKINGHSIEIRVYAEDPENNFLPDLGTLVHYEIPKGAGVRVDDGYRKGMSIPLSYDSMIAKLITHGPTREDAIDKMLNAIDHYQIYGCATTLGFARYVLKHPVFLDGSFTIDFVNQHYKTEDLKREPDNSIGLAAYSVFLKEKEKSTPKLEQQPLSNWRISRKEFQ